MSDNRSPLLPQNRGGIQSQKQFQKIYSDCLLGFNRIKQKNDVIQKTSDNDLDSDMVREIKKQGQFIQTEIKQLYTKLTAMKSKYKEPEQQNKIKKFQKDLGQQVERNKIIMTNYISRASSASFHMRRQSNLKISKDDAHQQKQKNIQYNSNSQAVSKSNINMLQQSEVFMEHRLQKQKNAVFQDVQKGLNRVQAIMNDMAYQVDKQGQDIDIIDSNVTNTKQNLLNANQNLEEAQHLQKKARKKYIICVAIILLVVLAGVGFYLVFR